MRRSCPHPSTCTSPACDLVREIIAEEELARKKRRQLEQFVADENKLEAAKIKAEVMAAVDAVEMAVE